MNKHQQSPGAILESSFGFRLPPAMHLEFEGLLAPDNKLTPEDINEFFCREYIENTTPFELTTVNFEKEFINTDRERLCCTARVIHDEKEQEITGIGNGTIDSLLNAFKTHFQIDFEMLDYLQHGLTQGSQALAASYIQLQDKEGNIFWGVGIDSDCTLSAVRALLSALNRSQR